MPWIIAYLLSELIEVGAFCPSVLEAMQVNRNTGFLERTQFVKYVNDPSIIRRPGHIKSDDM